MHSRLECSLPAVRLHGHLDIGCRGIRWNNQGRVLGNTSMTSSYWSCIYRSRLLLYCFYVPQTIIQFLNINKLIIEENFFYINLYPRTKWRDLQSLLKWLKNSSSEWAAPLVSSSDSQWGLKLFFAIMNIYFWEFFLNFWGGLFFLGGGEFLGCFFEFLGFFCGFFLGVFLLNFSRWNFFWLFLVLF